MATDAQIGAAVAAGRKPTKGDGFVENRARHQLGGASAPIPDDEQAAAEMFVRRAFNRHNCQAPRRRAEDERMGWARMQYPCDDPRHDEDVAAMAEALQWLGLRPTPRPERRSDALTARPKAQRRNGRCPVCERVKALRADGTLGVHQAGGRPCDGEGKPNVEER